MAWSETAQWEPAVELVGWWEVPPPGYEKPHIVGWWYGGFPVPLPFTFSM